MRGLRLTVTFLIGTVVAGCSAGPSTTSVASVPPVATAAQGTAASAPTNATSSTSAPALGSAVRGFMSADAANSDPTKMRAGLELAAPGSPAFSYLSHQANYYEAAADGGKHAVDQTTSDSGPDAINLCYDPADEKTCGKFAGFKLDPSGKVADFTVAGLEIATRLTVGNGDTVTGAGAKFTFLTAYLTATGNDLIVTLKVETGGKAISMLLYSATYRGPDGKQRQVSQAVGPMDVAADSNAMVGMTIPGVKPGGKVTLQVCPAKCAGPTADVVLQVG